jgi:phage repressor protein C with HTH and peptisase S24 domain
LRTKPKQRVTFDFVEAVARAMGKPFEWLAYGHEPAIGSAGDTSGAIPIIGIVAGSISGRPSLASAMGFIHRPPALALAPNAYAMYVNGSSMVPKFDHGDLIVVDPDRTPKPGDAVVLQLRTFDGDHIATSIKLLVSISDTVVTVHQLNPAGTIQHARSAVAAIDKVLKLAEIL